MKEYFLDSNAHVPMNKCAIKDYVECQTSLAGYGHPSSPSKIGREAANVIEFARADIANLLGAQDASQIIFTSTCTQACEWAIKIIKSVSCIYNRHIKISPLEHSAVKYSLRDYQLNFDILNIDGNGIITNFGNRNDINICLHVQNECGIIQPIENINGFLFSDMCQSVGKVPINLKEMNVDIAVFGAHKFGGPASIGILYLKDKKLWESFGCGSRYFYDRAGTPDIASISATSVALRETLFNMPEKLKNMQEFQNTLESILYDNGYNIICREAKRVSNTTLLNIPNVSFYVMQALSDENIFVGVGSACGSKHTGESSLMSALGKKGGTNDLIRISQSGNYGKEDAKFVANKILDITNYYKSKIKT